MMVEVTRKYRFSASHRLHVPAFSEAENDRTFGKCNNPYGHGHNYGLEVTVAGKVNPIDGRAVDIVQLDRIVHTHVLSDLDQRNLNEEVTEFATAVPTTENLATVIQHRLQRYWPADFPRLSRIRILETRNNTFEIANL